FTLEADIHRPAKVSGARICRRCFDDKRTKPPPLLRAARQLLAGACRVLLPHCSVVETRTWGAAYDFDHQTCASHQRGNSCIVLCSIKLCCSTMPVQWEL